jgi:WD40 repeat protein
MPRTLVLVAAVTLAFQGSACYGQEPWAVLHTEGGAVCSVAFSPDGKTLAVACDDGTIRLWGIPTGKSRLYRQKRDGFAFSLAFSPDGNSLAWGEVANASREEIYNGFVGDWPCCVRMLDLHTGKQQVLARARTKHYQVDVAYSSNGKTLAFCVDAAIRLLDLPSGRERTVVRGGGATAPELAFSPDGKVLAVSSGKEKKFEVRLWDVGTAKVKAIHPVEADFLGPMAFSPDGKVLGVGVGSVVRLWEVKSWKEVATLRGPEEVIRSLAFSSDGKTVATGASCSPVLLWDVQRGKQLRKVGPRPGFIHWFAVAFSRDGRLLASAGADGTVRLWSVPALLKAGK